MINDESSLNPKSSKRIYAFYLRLKASFYLSHAPWALNVDGSITLDHLHVLNPQIKCLGFNCLYLEKKKEEKKPAVIDFIIFKAFNVLLLKN